MFYLTFRMLQHTSSEVTHVYHRSLRFISYKATMAKEKECLRCGFYLI